MNCKETFSDIVAVWPFPAGKIDYDIPFNVRRRSMSKSALSLTDDSFLNTMVHYSVSESYCSGSVIELEENESTLRFTTKQGVGGRYHEVSLSLIISEESELSERMTEQLESVRHDFIIKDAEGTLLLVRTTDDAYECVSDVERTPEYRLRHNIKIDNYNGIIRLTD